MRRQASQLKKLGFLSERNRFRLQRDYWWGLRSMLQHQRDGPEEWAGEFIILADSDLDCSVCVAGRRNLLTGDVSQRNVDRLPFMPATLV